MRRMIEPMIDDNQFSVFILAVPIQTKFSLCEKFKIFGNLGSMPKMFPHISSTSKKHTTGFIVKRFEGCCGSVGALLLAVKFLRS